MAEQHQERSDSETAKRKAKEAGFKSKDEDSDLVIVSQDDWEKMTARVDSLTDSLRHEVSRRRDLQEDMDGANERLSSARVENDYCAKSIGSIISVLGIDGEHKDMVRVIVVKKRGMTMKAFYGHWENFQKQLLASRMCYRLPMLAQSGRPNQGLLLQLKRSETRFITGVLRMPCRSLCSEAKLQSPNKNSESAWAQ